MQTVGYIIYNPKSKSYYTKYDGIDISPGEYLLPDVSEIETLTLRGNTKIYASSEAAQDFMANFGRYDCTRTNFENCIVTAVCKK